MNTSTDSNEIETPESSGGFIVGQAADSKAGFHGEAVVQRAGSAQAAVAATAATNSSPYGYSEAQANAIVTLLNEIRAALIEKGIIKGEA